MSECKQEIREDAKGKSRDLFWGTNSVFTWKTKEHNENVNLDSQDSSLERKPKRSLC
jgi:hypothetical protein